MARLSRVWTTLLAYPVCPGEFEMKSSKCTPACKDEAAPHVTHPIVMQTGFHGPAHEQPRLYPQHYNRKEESLVWAQIGDGGGPGRVCGCSTLNCCSSRVGAMGRPVRGFSRDGVPPLSSRVTCCRLPGAAVWSLQAVAAENWLRGTAPGLLAEISTRSRPPALAA